MVEYIYEREKFKLDNLKYSNLKSKTYIKINTILEKFHNMVNVVLSDSDIKTKYQNYYAKGIIFPLLQGKTIIADTIELENYFQVLEHHLFQCRKDTIVVYCSPQNLEEHIIQRNKTTIKFI